MAGRRKLPKHEKKKVVRIFVKAKYHLIAKRELKEYAKKYE